MKVLFFGLFFSLWSFMAVYLIPHYIHKAIPNYFHGLPASGVLKIGYELACTKPTSLTDQQLAWYRLDEGVIAFIQYSN